VRVNVSVMLSEFIECSAVFLVDLLHLVDMFSHSFHAMQSLCHAHKFTEKQTEKAIDVYLKQKLEKEKTSLKCETSYHMSTHI